MGKYRNKSIVIDGIKFDSKKEGNAYLELKQKERKGLIKNLQLQVKFELIPSQYLEVEHFGKKKTKCVERPCTYIADFVYEDLNGNKVVIDTKGFKTKDYIIKRKLMLFLHKIQITEI